MQPSNLLHISLLTEGWCDKDHVMLHACFQLLTDFVEKELPVAWWLTWEHDEEHIHAKKEIDALYEWWIQWRAKVDAPGFVHTLADYEKENEMLKRLIDVRGYLWS